MRGVGEREEGMMREEREEEDMREKERKES